MTCVSFVFIIRKWNWTVLIFYSRGAFIVNNDSVKKTVFSKLIRELIKIRTCNFNDVLLDGWLLSLYELFDFIKNVPFRLIKRYLYKNSRIYQKWFLYQSYYIENKETDTDTQMIKKYTIYNIQLLLL